MPIEANHIRAVVHTRLNAEANAVNVLWYQSNLSPAEGEEGDWAVSVASAIEGKIATEWRGMLAQDCTFRGIEVAASIGGNVFVASYFTNASPGTAGLDSLPAYAAAIIQKRTNQPGRAGRGRWYISGIAEDLTNGSVLTPAGQTQLTGLALVLSEDVTLGESYVLTPTHVKGDGTLHAITSTRGLTTLGTMRRRMVRPTL